MATDGAANAAQLAAGNARVRSETRSKQKSDPPDSINPPSLAISILVILCSIVIHGMTAGAVMERVERSPSLAR